MMVCYESKVEQEEGKFVDWILDTEAPKIDRDVVFFISIVAPPNWSGNSHHAS